MRVKEQQLTLPGVELANLELWKLANGVHTGEIKGLAWNKENHSWAAWTDYESPVIFMCQNDHEEMGYGETEKAAILDYCNGWHEKEINKPDWW